MGQLCWECDELIGGAVSVGEDLNREAGAAIVQFGDAINPLVSLDDEEIEAAKENEQLGLTGDNIISDQFDAEPGGGVVDTTIGGTVDVLSDVGNGLVDLGGDVVGGGLAAVLEEFLEQITKSPVLLGLAVLVGIYVVGQLFDVELGGSST